MENAVLAVGSYMCVKMTQNYTEGLMKHSQVCVGTQTYGTTKSAKGLGSQ